MKNIINRMNLGMKHLLNVMMFVMVIVVFLQVLFRFVIDSPLAWTEEMARYLLIWITFLGAAYAMSVKAHPGVEIVVEKLPKRLQKGVLVISTLLSILFFLILITQSIEMIQRSMIQTSPALHLPMGWVYTIIPVSSVLFLINLLYITITELVSKGER